MIYIWEYMISVNYYLVLISASEWDLQGFGSLFAAIDVYIASQKHYDVSGGVLFLRFFSAEDCLNIV